MENMEQISIAFIFYNIELTLWKSVDISQIPK